MPRVPLTASQLFELSSPDASLAALARLHRRNAVNGDLVQRRAMEFAESTVARARGLGVKIMTPSDGEYPIWLKGAPARPAVLFLRGRLRHDMKHVACIGTRDPSRFGREVTRRLATRLAQAGWTIVSGLARGVDAIAHEAALDAGGHTVAVLGNGLDTVYPSEHARLAARILDAGGALVSEQVFGTPALPRHLVQRDRIQSGMCAATVVMQTDLRGGSMHTVRFALEQDRLLFAPSPAGPYRDEPQSRGLVALTSLDGPGFAAAVAARGGYASLLAKYRQCSVALPIEGRNAYPDVEARLATMLQLRSAALVLDHKLRQSPGTCAADKAIVAQHKGQSRW